MDKTSFLSTRNTGLDFLRALLILEGVLYHAARSLPGGNSWYYLSEKNESAFFTSLIEFVHTFRMEAFFFLSGMFSAMVFLRKGKDFFIQNRKKRVLVPLISAFAFIPGVMYLLAATIKGSEITAAGLAEGYTHLHHLWFLVSLSAMSFFIPGSVYAKIAAIFRRLPFPVLVGTLIVSCNFFFVLKFLLKDAGELVSLIPVTARFCVYYAAGYALYLNRDKIPEIAKSPLLHSGLVAALALVCYAAFYATFHYNPGGVMKYLPALASSVFSVIFSYWIVFCFEKMRLKENRLVNGIVDSALVVYIMHYPLTISLAWLLDDYFPDNLSVTYVVTVTTVALILSACCYGFIKRIPVLATLFGLKPASTKIVPVANPVAK